ncbi:hypothetical protein Hamer_G009541 [Homarus americanus]|uniref:Uncharacterized protein n=1 Tax=Homarus americanus TaxID=6706 RepID=A0A8J5N2M6_HOMAM|nr:hypothetical protein Hamer_G009541 [Homarus americanus]
MCVCPQEVQPNTCNPSNDVGIFDKGWQVFGMPLKEEEFQGQIQDVDEIVKKEEIDYDENMSYEQPEKDVSVKEENLDSDMCVTVGSQYSDASEKEDSDGGNLYVTVGIQDTSADMQEDNI